MTVSGDESTDSAISKAEEGRTNMFISKLIHLEGDLSASQRQGRKDIRGNKQMFKHAFIFNNLLNFYRATGFRRGSARLDTEVVPAEFHNVHSVPSSRMRAMLIMFQQKLMVGILATSRTGWRTENFSDPVCGKVM